MIKAIILDMGGVVLHGKIETVLDCIAEELHISKEEFSQLFRAHKKELQEGKMKISQLCELVKEKYGIEKDILPIWKKCYLAIMTFNTEVLELITKLRKNYKIAVITNTSDIHTKINRERDAFKYFDEAIASSEAGMVKPNKEIYEAMLGKLKVKPEECIFVDDRESQVEPAVALGMKGLVFTDIKKFIEDLKRLGVKI